MTKKQVEVYFLMSRMFAIQMYRMMEHIHLSDMLTLQKNPDKADLLVLECSHVTATKVQNVIDKYPQKSIILLNKMDSPMLTQVVRNNLHKDNVKIVYSAGALVDKKNYNSPLPYLENLPPHECDASGPCPHKHFPVGYFNCILNDHYKEISMDHYREQTPRLSDESLEKIKIAPMTRTNIEAFNFHLYNAWTFDCDEDDYSKRDIDVSFVGQSWRGHELFGTHRFHVEEILNSMKKRHGLKTTCILNHRTDHSGRKQDLEGPYLDLKKYSEVLLRSKVVIGAWGAGEWCQRDAEAVYTGAVLIKPDMSHMEVYPNFYLKDETYVSCSPGLKDLEEKILKVLNNWQDYTNMRVRAKEIITESFDIAKHRQMFEKDVTNILTGGE